MKPNVRIVEVLNGDPTCPKHKPRNFYKIQQRLWNLFWTDCRAYDGRIWPTFDTLEEAEDYVSKTFFCNERVVREYNAKFVN